MKLVKHWKRVSREAVESASLDVFKSRVEKNVAGMVELGMILP